MIFPNRKPNAAVVVLLISAVALCSVVNAQGLKVPRLLQGEVEKAKINEKALLQKQAADRLMRKVLENVIPGLNQKPKAAALEVDIAVPNVAPVILPGIAVNQRRIVFGGDVIMTPAQQVSQPVASNAELHLDEDQLRRLRKAREFAKAGRFDLSVPLWQKVLDEAGDRLALVDSGQTEVGAKKDNARVALVKEKLQEAIATHGAKSAEVKKLEAELKSQQEFAKWVGNLTGNPQTANEPTITRYRKYEPVSKQIEREIAALPKAGLREYRLYADPDAKILLASATPEQRQLALARVADRFFLSSIGDDAAFELACGKLERNEFGGALALFRRILNDYPNSDIPGSQILLRMSVAAARMGDVSSADDSMSQLAAIGATSKRTMELVRADIATFQQRQPKREVVSGWPMPFGSVSHSAVMPNWKTGEKNLSGLTEIWTRTPALEFSSIFELPKNVQRVTISTNGKRRECYYVNGVMIDPAKYEEARKRIPSREELAKRWRKRGVFPVGDTLFSTSASGSETSDESTNGLAWFKNGSRVICVDTKTGREVWKGRKNDWQSDPQAKMRALQSLSPYQNAGTPSFQTNAEIDLFSDHLQQSMSVFGNRLFTIEGDLPGKKQNADAQQIDPRMMFWGRRAPQASTTRSRQNWLTAYDARNGTLQWSRSTAKDGKAAGGAFLSAPVATGNALLVPASIDGRCILLALEQSSGNELWRTNLSNEINTSGPQMAQASIAIRGGTAFVCTGTGFLQSIDVTTGALNWSLQYMDHTAVAQDPPLRGGGLRGFGRGMNVQAVKVFQPTGRRDFVVVTGASVVVVASDNDRMFAVNPQTGDLQWSNPKLDTGIKYVAGISGESIVLGGSSTLQQFDLQNGDLNWTIPLKASCGRAAITETEILVPDGDSILRLNPKTGKETSRINVVNGTGEPVGNLYSNGNDLLVMGLGRLYSLGNIDARLAELSQEIKKQDNVDTRFARAAILGRIEKLDEAAADIEAGFVAMADSGMSTRDRNERLFDVLNTTRLAAANPQATLSWFTRARELEVANGELVPRKSEMRDRVLAATMKAWPTTTAGDESSGTSAQPPAALKNFKIDDVLFLAPYFSTSSLQQLAENLVQEIATTQDEDLLRKALKSKDITTVAIARVGLEIVLAKADAPRLLEMLKSTDENEQLAGATALATIPHRETLPVLLNLLKSKAPDVRTKAINLLRGMTGQNKKYDPTAAVYKRRNPTLKWQKWVAAHGKTFALRKVTRSDRRKTESALSQLITIDVTAERTSKILKMLGQQTNTNINCPVVIANRITTVKFTRVTLRSALTSMLRPLGYSFRVKGNMIEVQRDGQAGLPNLNQAPDAIFDFVVPIIR